MNFIQSQFYEAGDQLLMDETDFYVLAAIFAPFIWGLWRAFAPVVSRSWLALGNHGPKCPKCGTANTVQRLNFVSEEDRKAFYAHNVKTVETFVDCKKCGHRYAQTYVLPQNNTGTGHDPGGEW